MENKIKKIIHRMIEKRHGESKKKVMRMALMSVLADQVKQGRVDDEDDMLAFVDMMLDEFYAMEEEDASK